MKAKTLENMTPREKVIKILKIDAIILTIFSLFVMGTILKNDYLIWGALITLVIFVNSILNNKRKRKRNRIMSYDDDEGLTAYNMTVDPIGTVLYGDD